MRPWGECKDSLSVRSGPTILQADGCMSNPALNVLTKRNKACAWLATSDLENRQLVLNDAPDCETAQELNQPLDFDLVALPRDCFL